MSSNVIIYDPSYEGDFSSTVVDFSQTFNVSGHFSGNGVISTREYSDGLYITGGLIPEVPASSATFRHRKKIFASSILKNTLESTNESQGHGPFFAPISHQSSESQPTVAMSKPVYDALILGAGPAGLSAALGLARVKRTALVLSNSAFRNQGIEAMHGILGYDGAHPESYRRIAREQIEKYGAGIQFADGEAVRVGKINLEGAQGFEVQLRAGKVFKGRKIVLAMGSKDAFPGIEGYAENWPDNMYVFCSCGCVFFSYTNMNSSYQCLFCDGRERSHLPIGLIGFPSAATLGHVMMVCHLSGEKPNVTIFTNGPLGSDPALREAAKAAELAGCVFEERKIVKLDRLPDGQIGVDVRLEDGTVRRMGFLQDKPPTEAVGERMLVDGLEVEIAKDALGSFIKRSEPFGETNVKGCFVVGDAGTSLKQVTVAVSQGILGAVGVSMQVCAAEAERALASVKQIEAEEVDVEKGDR